MRQLWFQVLAATVVGVVLGLVQPDLGARMKPLGDAFIALVRMLTAPIVFCTVVQGVAAMESMAKAGRATLKALIYFEVITTLALIIGLTAVNLWRPGSGLHIDPAHLDPKAVAQYATQAHEQGVVEFLMALIPRSFFSAFTDGQVLPVLLVSVLFAMALGRLGETGKPVLNAVASLGAVFFRAIDIIMVFAPIGAFGAIAFAVGKFGAASLGSLGSLIAEFYVVCGVFTLIVLGGVAALLRINLFRLIGYLRDEVVLVAATTSTETVLPRLIDKLERLGCQRSIVGLVVPLGYSFNLDGTCLYLATVSVFLAEVVGGHPSLGQQISLMLVMLLTSKGAAGVAGAAFIVLAATLAATGAAPVAAIGLILGVHRILAEALTFVNLIGNALAALAIAAWEGALDRTRLTEQLSPARIAA